MNKLSLDALKERANGVATLELLQTISGGTENSCHVADPLNVTPAANAEYDNAWGPIQTFFWGLFGIGPKK